MVGPLLVGGIGASLAVEISVIFIDSVGALLIDGIEASILAKISIRLIGRARASLDL